MLCDQLGHRRAWANHLQHIAVGVANKNRLCAAKIASSGDGDAVFGNKSFCGLRIPNLDRQKVATKRLIVVASPEYLRGAGTQKTADELALHDCIVGFLAIGARTRNGRCARATR